MACKITLILAFALLAVASTSAQFYGGFGGYAGGLGHGGYAGGFGHGGYAGGYGHGHGHYAYPKYQFAYGVQDKHTGDNKQVSEHRDGGFTQTQYSSNLVHG